MKRIVHYELGEPSQVLRVEDGPSEPLGPNQVRVRPSYAPIHPGDLLGIMGSPAFGTPPTISPGGRVPGFEGAGIISDAGALVDPGLGLRPGLRVAFFSAPCSRLPSATPHRGSPTPWRMLVGQAGSAWFFSTSPASGRPHHEVRNDRRWCGRAWVCAGSPEGWSSSRVEQFRMVDYPVPRADMGENDVGAHRDFTERPWSRGPAASGGSLSFRRPLQGRKPDHGRDA